ncbi:alpha-2 adrenergic receptor-like [Clytia hemisphaerica]|uniref:alpha-2 adrenergic receptor-like n=1 Tax=Clytia hemisphaerica TaxID=252671 RepID=UPI0034D4DFDA
MLNTTLINRYNMLYTNSTNTTLQPPNRMMVDFCDLPRKMTNNIAFAFLIIFIPITVIGNLLVIAVVASSKSLKKQTTFLFLSSLAVADTLVGLVSMPFNARIQWKSGFLCLGDRACWTYNLEESFLSITSVIHLFIIGLDRYLSLRYVYQYNSLATKRRVKIVIAGIWCFSAFMASMLIFQWDDPSKIAIISRGNICAARNETFYTSMYIGCFIIPLFVMVYMYAYVYKTASHHILEINSGEKQRNESWWVVLHFVLINFLPPLNSTTNPCIYVICNKQFRKVCRQLYYKLSNQEQRTMQFATTLITEAHDLVGSRHHSTCSRETAKIQ